MEVSLPVGMKMFTSGLYTSALSSGRADFATSSPAVARCPLVERLKAFWFNRYSSIEDTLVRICNRLHVLLRLSGFWKLNDRFVRESRVKSKHSEHACRGG